MVTESMNVITLSMGYFTKSMSTVILVTAKYQWNCDHLCMGYCTVYTVQNQ